MQIKYISHAKANPPGLLRKTAAIVATAAVAGAALMFSAALLAVAVAFGAIASAYLWWKTRELRKQMRNFPPRGDATQSKVFKGEVFEGEVIEGEAIRVDESRHSTKP